VPLELELDPVLGVVDEGAAGCVVEDELEPDEGDGVLVEVCANAPLAASASVEKAMTALIPCFICTSSGLGNTLPPQDACPRRQLPCKRERCARPRGLSRADSSPSGDRRCPALHASARRTPGSARCRRDRRREDREAPRAWWRCRSRCDRPSG